VERKLESWIDGFVQYTDNSEAAEIYRRWCAISTVAAALKRKCFLQWQTSIHANMYIVLVGPSGGRKGTAMGPAAEFLANAGIKISADSVTREALIMDLEESTETVQNETDFFMHASLTVFSPELAVFLGQQNLQLISDMTDWFDCRATWTYKTKNKGTNSIQNVFVNLIGATTPSILRVNLPSEAVGGGLTSRMIFVYAPGKEKLVPLPHMSVQNTTLKDALTHDLEVIMSMRGQFRITEQFARDWTKWYMVQDANPPFDDEVFHGYLERRPTHVLKLSMIISASKTSDMIITEEHLAEAIALLERTEVNMPQVFAGYGRLDTADLIPAIARRIKIAGTIDRADLVKRYITEITPSQLDEIISALCSSDFCSLSYSNEGRVTIKYKEGPNGY
jgi:hypothetical protein